MQVSSDSEALLRRAMGLEGDDSPFPWQIELLKKFLKGEIPEACDIPTGLGKTAVMHVWLVARAYGAPIPRRLVYVVDRRAVVDQATEAAILLREFVESDPEVKSKLGLDKAPLPISTLRGQFVDNREWLANPAWPAIVVGTVDMVGSRLLFEGYGVSRRMRPYHAGLLGVDSLVVLDEAHLVPPFEHLLRSIATAPVFRPRDTELQGIVKPLVVMPLSATARSVSSNCITLTDEDHKHPVAARRLNARKTLRLVRLQSEETIEEALARQAWSLSKNGSVAARIVVFSDSRETALKAKGALEKLAGGGKKKGTSKTPIDTELLVGARRVFERDKARKRLCDLGFLPGEKGGISGPRFLFATSAGEVGVDLDADHMVCDLVAWERMVQRLGRVNRRGEREGHEAQVVVLVPPEPEMDNETKAANEKRSKGEKLNEKEGKLIEKYEERVQAWKARHAPLEHLPKQGNEEFDVSVRALVELSHRASREPEVQAILKAARTPEPLRPALNLALVEAWSLTSLEKHPGRPAVQPWLRGWVEEVPQTAIVWRKFLPVRRGGTAPRAREIEAFFEAAPIHLSEVLETEHYVAAEWLQKRAEKALRKGSGETLEKDAETARPLSDDAIVAFVLAEDGSFKRSFRLREIATIKGSEIAAEVAGCTLIVDARLGGLKDGVLDAEDDAEPMASDGSEWLGPGVVGFRIRRCSATEPIPREREWRERFRYACEVSEEGEAEEWLIVEKWQSDAAMEDDRAEGQPVLLNRHAREVEQEARNLCRALGVPQPLQEAVALAARLHDQGKKAERWQRAFHAPTDGIYAKTEGPIDHGLLDGYRHEVGSLVCAEQDPQVRQLERRWRELVLHLIAAHHGYARPVLSIEACDFAPPSVLQEKGVEAALRFARLQRAWGPWGLAWCEALLRAADQTASVFSPGEPVRSGCSDA